MARWPLIVAYVILVGVVTFTSWQTKLMLDALDQVECEARQERVLILTVLADMADDLPTQTRTRALAAALESDLLASCGAP